MARTHWQIETGLHWALDVVMNEDGSRSRKDHAPQNLARLRRSALDLLRADQDKGSTRGKIKRAAWDDTFLLKVLADAYCDGLVPGVARTGHPRRGAAIHTSVPFRKPRSTQPMSRYVPLILFTVTTNAVAQILLKQGVGTLGKFELTTNSILHILPRIIFNYFIILGLCTFVISMTSHLIVLSRVDLSFAYPFLSLAYVIVTAYAYFIFDENVNLYRIAGIILICIGTILIARS